VHRDENEAIALYNAARQRGLRPALLESLGPRTHFGRRTVLGVAPARRLEVWDGVLYDDGEQVGDAPDLLTLIETETGGAFFPAWVGFFSYEYARHLGLPTNAPMPGFPDAAFFLYPSGYVWEDGHLRESPEPGSTADGVSPEPVEDAGLPAIDLVSDYPVDAFVAGVEEVQERIRAGWVYQVNLSHRFHFDARELDPLAFYAALRRTNPSPFFGMIEGGGDADAGGPRGRWAVVSGSPERLFDFADGAITARPIAGTRPRGADAASDDDLEEDLRTDRKEQAEHVMLVDLLRNDIARVSEPGTVEVTEAFTVERYSHVMHLVSEVRGRSDAPLGDAVRAIFPGGTITGAPKESVMREIARLEPVPRGAYTGSLGFASGLGADFNILIRSLTLAGDTAYISGGGGIVIESEPTNEYMETRHKVEALLHVLGKGRRGQPAAGPRRDYSWLPPRPRQRYDARVLFVECHDSYSYNIIDYLRCLGAEIDVVDHEEAPGAAGASHPALATATHMVIGPGPGDPETSGAILAWVAASLERRLPFLGVCLGHQALGVALGASLARAPRPVHGEAHPMHHTGRGIFAGLASPELFTRYHSLCLCDLPPTLTREAWTGGTTIAQGARRGNGGRGAAGRPGGDGPDDAVVMAVAHTTLPAWGVQFHPESMLSRAGLALLANFLEVRAG
jgi:anthranilate synthase/aminodeoxychorismate synthase-like glutamine amidotransferase